MSAKFKYFVVTCVALLAFLTCSSAVAYAYVDPGTGLLVYQSVTAFATGVMFYFRRRLKLFLFRKTAEPAKPQGDTEIGR